MTRILVCLGVFVSLAALAGAWSAAPLEQGKATAAKPAAPAVKRTVAEKLQQVVDYPGLDDPKATLIDELDHLTRLCGAAFDVNEKAFRSEMLNDVLKTEIASPNAIPPMKRRLKAVLRQILARIPVASGATYLVRGDAVEVTTHLFASAEIYHPRREPFNPLDDEKADGGGIAGLFTFPLVVIDARKKPLVEALDELADDNDVNIVLDRSVGEEKAKTLVTLRARNVPADSAVLMLAGMADLHCVQIDNALFVSTREKAAALRNAHTLRRTRRTDADAGEQLGGLLKKVEGETDRIGGKILDAKKAAPKKP